MQSRWNTTLLGIWSEKIRDKFMPDDSCSDYCPCWNFCSSSFLTWGCCCSDNIRVLKKGDDIYEFWTWSNEAGFAKFDGTNNEGLRPLSFFTVETVSDLVVVSTILCWRVPKQDMKLFSPPPPNVLLKRDELLGVCPCKFMLYSVCRGPTEENAPLWRQQAPWRS